VKKNRIGTLVFGFFLALSTLFSGGCVVLVSAAAAGGVAYYKGSLTATLPCNVEKVESAVRATLEKDLRFALINSAEDAVGAEYTARNSQDEKIVIKLKRVDDAITKIDIRVGVFGDESTSQLILRKIEKRLN
jgi:hypothetical protein